MDAGTLAAAKVGRFVTLGRVVVALVEDLEVMDRPDADPEQDGVPDSDPRHLDPAGDMADAVLDDD